MMCSVTVSGTRTDYFPYRWTSSVECWNCGSLHHASGTSVLRRRQKLVWEKAWAQALKVAENHETYPIL